MAMPPEGRIERDGRRAELSQAFPRYFDGCLPCCYSGLFGKGGSDGRGVTKRILSQTGYKLDTLLTAYLRSRHAGKLYEYS